jgi:hypothetical protein
MVNPLTLIGTFFRWIGLRQSRETGLKTAQLNLAEEQHRAEVFALEQSLQITESERDGLKSQLASAHRECNTATSHLKAKQDEIDRLHNQLNFFQQQASKERVDREAEKMLVWIAKQKNGWTKDVWFKFCFGHETPKGEYFFAQLFQAGHVEKIGVDDKGIDLWGATEKGKQLAFSPRNANR